MDIIQLKMLLASLPPKFGSCSCVPIPLGDPWSAAGITPGWLLAGLGSPVSCFPGILGASLPAGVLPGDPGMLLHVLVLCVSLLPVLGIWGSQRASSAWNAAQTLLAVLEHSLSQGWDKGWGKGQTGRTPQSWGLSPPRSPQDVTASWHQQQGRMEHWEFSRSSLGCALPPPRLIPASGMTHVAHGWSSAALLWDLGGHGDTGTSLWGVPRGFCSALPAAGGETPERHLESARRHLESTKSTWRAPRGTWRPQQAPGGPWRCCSGHPGVPCPALGAPVLSCSSPWMDLSVGRLKTRKESLFCLFVCFFFCLTGGGAVLSPGLEFPWTSWDLECCCSMRSHPPFLGWKAAGGVTACRCFWKLELAEDQTLDLGEFQGWAPLDSSQERNWEWLEVLENHLG